MQRIIISAGGTAGHVIPAFLIAQELINQQHSVFFITDYRGEKYLPRSFSKKQYIVLDLVNASVSGSSKLKKIQNRLNFFIKLLGGIMQTIGTFVRFKPTKVIGFGGYPSLPALLMGWLWRIPFYVHEQNAVLGRTNRFMQSKLRHIFTSFPNTAKCLPSKTIHMGMPVRMQSRQKGLTYIQGQTFTLTIFGGSQGAQALGKIIPQALALLPLEIRSWIKVIHQVRHEDVKNVQNEYEVLGIKAFVQPYFDDMVKILSLSHLLIARAGASTIFESIAYLLPTIFIPLPSAMDNHQVNNASYLFEIGGGWILSQGILSPINLASMLGEIFRRPEVLYLAQKMLKNLQRHNVIKDLATCALTV